LPQRTSSGYRIYDDNARDRLHFIGKAKDMGLTLEEIREIFEIRGSGAQPCEHVLWLLDQKLAAVDEQLRKLADFRQELLGLRKEAVKSGSASASICQIIEQHKETRG
jgi:DNA-binding transcriptional MerR regulator